jgi:hypothetical protein
MITYLQQDLNLKIKILEIEKGEVYIFSAFYFGIGFF